MNKNSLIRQFLERNGFRQLGNKNSYLAYYDEFCFTIDFEKACYGSRWEIAFGVYVVHARRNTIGIYPDQATQLMGGIGSSITIATWETDKDKHPDRHTDSIIFVIDNYILPIYSNICLNKKVDDFEYAQYITKSTEKHKINNDFKFKPILTVKAYDINELLSSSEFNIMFNYLNNLGFKYDKKACILSNYELYFFNEKRAIYIVVIIEEGLFLSFGVIPKKFYSKMDIILHSNGLRITYFEKEMLRFGWLIGNRLKCEENINQALKQLKVTLDNMPQYIKSLEKPPEKSATELYMEMQDRRYEQQKEQNKKD